MSNPEVLQYTKDLVKTHGKEYALRLMLSTEEIAARPFQVTLSDESDVRNIGKKERRTRSNLNFFRMVITELKREMK